MIAGHPDLEVFHGSAWLDFLAASQGAEPVTAVVRADGRPVGFFVGAIVRRYGIRILGSPLRGWGTQCMGFLLEVGFDRQIAAEALLLFAFHHLRCLHVELADRQLTADLMAGSSYIVEVGHTFVVDLRPDEEAIARAMRPTTRNYLRRARRNGLTVERSTDLEFADEYWAQLAEVFARQNLVPTYGVERVRQLIGCVQPSGHLLLLRIRSPRGDCIATAILVGHTKTVALWGAAFRRTEAELHPNEVLHWEAMRFWREQGAERYDLGGAGDYKAKYGGVETPTFHFHRSRYRIMRVGRSAIRNIFRVRQRLAGRRTRAGSGDHNRRPTA